MMPCDALAIHTETSCPVCGAKQPWTSDTCRRCRCDLSLIQGVLQRARTARARCLWFWKHDDFDQALIEAERYAALLAGRDADRLVASCHLACGHWLAAARVARRSSRRDAEP